MHKAERHPTLIPGGTILHRHKTPPVYHALVKSPTGLVRMSRRGYTHYDQAMLYAQLLAMRWSQIFGRRR